MYRIWTIIFLKKKKWTITDGRIQFLFDVFFTSEPVHLDSLETEKAHPKIR